MPSYTDTIGTTNWNQFKILLDRSQKGTPPGEGWGVFEDVECHACGAMFVAVAMIGSKGISCPRCGFTDDSFIFRTQNECNGDGSCLCPVGFEHSELITRN